MADLTATSRTPPWLLNRNFALRQRDGTLLWQHTLPSSGVEPVVAHSIVYVSTFISSSTEKSKENLPSKP